MKTNVILILSFVVVAGLSGCDPSPDRKDTKETTDARNDANIEAVSLTDSSAKAQKDDAEDIVSIASAGMMEVQLAKIALNKATTPKVKEFAQMMIDDHTKANKELEKLAMEKNIILPPALTDKHQKIVNDMAEKTGKDFDKKYMNVMLDDHKEDIDKFQKIADKGNDPALKAFAAKTLPTLIHHREVAEVVEKMTDKL